MIVLLWLSLIFIPLVTGEGLLSAFYGKNRREHSEISQAYVLGEILCIGVAEVAHVIGMFLNFSVKKTGAIFSLMLLGLVLAASVVLAATFWKQRKAGNSCLRIAREKTMLPFVFIGIMFLQILFIFCREPIVVPGDITLETVQSFLAEDGIYRVMPLTGSISEAGVPLRYKILCLPTLYTMLCNAFGIEASLLVCHIIPVAVLAGAYISFYYLSGVLFSKDDLRKRYLFLLILALLFLVTDRGEFSGGYGLLHGGYLGTSVRNLILVPYALAASLEKRWWKVFLCILAEACVAWTFWGMGVCVVIFMGIGVLSLLENRCPGVYRFMQIFRNEEDLT